MNENDINDPNLYPPDEDQQPDAPVVPDPAPASAPAFPTAAEIAAATQMGVQQAIQAGQKQQVEDQNSVENLNLRAQQALESMDFASYHQLNQQITQKVLEGALAQQSQELRQNFHVQFQAQEARGKLTSGLSSAAASKLAAITDYVGQANLVAMSSDPNGQYVIDALREKAQRDAGGGSLRPPASASVGGGSRMSPIDERIDDDELDAFRSGTTMTRDQANDAMQRAAARKR